MQEVVCSKLWSRPNPPILPSPTLLHMILLTRKGTGPKGKGNGGGSRAKPQKGAKVARITQTRSSCEGPVMERGRDRYAKVQAWNPPILLNESPLPSDASIRDFQ